MRFQTEPTLRARSAVAGLARTARSPAADAATRALQLARRPHELAAEAARMSETSAIRTREYEHVLALRRTALDAIGPPGREIRLVGATAGIHVPGAEGPPLATAAAERRYATMMLRAVHPVRVQIENAQLRFVEPGFRAMRRVERISARERAVEADLDVDQLRTAKRLTRVLDYLIWGHALRFREQVAAEGEEVIVDLLARVLLEERAQSAFLDAAQRASTLRALNRRRLQHALDHLSRREYEEAFPPLIIGVEGALRDIARNRGVRARMSNAASVADHLRLDPAEQLLVAAVFDAVNDARHGAGDNPRRDCVLALLALLIWIGQEFSAPVLRNWLTSRLDDELDSGRLLAA